MLSSDLHRLQRCVIYFKFRTRDLPVRYECLCKCKREGRKQAPAPGEVCLHSSFLSSVYQVQAIFCWGEALYTMHSSVLHADWIKLNWQLFLLWVCEAVGLKPRSLSKVRLFPVGSLNQPPFGSFATGRYSFMEQKLIDTGSERARPIF